MKNHMIQPNFSFHFHFILMYWSVPKSKQRKLKAQIATKKRWSKDKSEVVKPRADPTMMVISCYENGCTYKKAKGILAAQGVESLSKSTFYCHQKKVNSNIIELSKESIQEEANQMTVKSHLSYDGAFSHRHNSSQWHSPFMNCKTGKIVAFNHKRKKKMANFVEIPYSI